MQINLRNDNYESKIWGAEKILEILRREIFLWEATSEEHVLHLRI